MKNIRTKNYCFFFLFLFVASASLLGLSAKAQQEAQEQTEPSVTIMAGSFEDTIPRKEISSLVSITPVLSRNFTKRTEIENGFSCKKSLVLCSLLLSERDTMHIYKTSGITIKEDAMDEFLHDIARRVNKDPIDAKFTVKEGRVIAFALSKNGIQLNIPESARLLRDTLRSMHKGSISSIALAYDLIPPQIRTGDVDSLGITDLIGEGRSDFSGSTKDRIHNITVAANRFNGLLIKPGEEFSFVKILGPVDAEHGYKEELVIRDHKTEPEFGGGICQVSTTTFRAAIFSGLEITVRRNHSYPVKYYTPTGFDATVYLPAPDLRFINNTPKHILVQTEIEGTELIFRFYGTPDGRKTEMEGPFVTERNPDGSMKTYFVQKVYNKDGTMLLEDTFKSVYKSPADYPKPGDISKFTEKPNGWSDNEWKHYKKDNGI